jgi:transcriptional regulator with XRE-family HTH domain
VTISIDQPAPAVVRLAERLRDLRESAPMSLTQSDLGQALADAKGAAVSAAAVSSWENPSSGRLVPLSRLEAYARLFCTPRAFEGGVRLLIDTELTADERNALAELKEELVGLRNAAAVQQAAPTGDARSMWHFPDGSRITLVCSRLPPERRPASANPEELNYVRFSDLADLDALIDIYGAVRAYNPTSRVVIMAAQDLTKRDIANHLVLIGGLAWATVNPWFSRIFPIPIQAGDPADIGAIVVNDPDDGENKFEYQVIGSALVEDVGFFARGANPSAPRRTLTICGGVTTRGVRGAASCFIDYEMRERNEQYLFPRFPEGSTYCIVMRVPVVNNDPLTPDLSKKENRLFEWHEGGAEAE